MSANRDLGTQIVCGAICIVTLVIFLTELFTNHQQYDPNGPEVVLEKPQMLEMAFGTDTLDLSLKSGDTIKILGIDRTTYRQTYLVETTDGDRGWLDTYSLPLAQIMVDGNENGDTVSIVGQKFRGKTQHVDGYIAKLYDGTEVETRADEFEPIIKNWTNYKLSNVTITSIGTEDHYRSMLGLSLPEIEHKIGPAYQILHQNGETVAQFKALSYDLKDGKSYYPIYRFNSEGLSDNVYFEYHKDRNDWLLKRIPGVSMILNMPFTSMIIRTSIYEKGATSETISGLEKFLMIALAVIILTGSLVWLFMTPSILTLAMGNLMAFPKVFYFLSDSVLKWLMIGITISLTYYWTVVMLAWGMFWWITPIIFVTSWYLCRYAISDLCTIPHTRCPHCKRLHTIALDDHVLYDTKYEKGADVVKGKLLDTSYSKYKTWTQVTKTTTYGDGHKESSSWRENETNHKIKHNTYQMIDYEVTYRVDFYHNHYICEECNYEEIIDTTEMTEVDRKFVGSHEGTFSNEV